MGERVTLAEFESVIRAEDYPIDGDMLRAMYGDYILDLAAGEESVGVVLERGSSSDTYQDPADVLEEVFCTISVDGVGQPGYTDRGGIAGLNRRWSF